MNVNPPVSTLTPHLVCLCVFADLEAFCISSSWLSVIVLNLFFLGGPRGFGSLKSDLSFHGACDQPNSAFSSTVSMGAVAASTVALF